MAGYGLTNAVQSYMQGADWRQQRDARQKDDAFQEQQRERLVKRQAVEDQQFDVEQEAQGVARDAYEKTMQGFQQQAGPSLGELNTAPGIQAAPVDPGQQREWNKRAVLASLDARSDFLAGKGDMQAFMKNEAAAMPYRAEVRSAAIDRALVGFKTTKDPIALAKTVHEFIFDGRDITDATQDGDKISFTLSDGSKQVMTADEILQTAQYMRDPKAAAEYEAKTRWELAKAQIEAQKQAQIETHKGEVEKDVEGVKQTNRLGLESARGANEMRQIGARNAGDLATAKEKGAQDRLTNAEKPQKTPEQKRLRSDALQRLVINSGIGTPDPVTGQARGNADSNRVALRAEQWMDQYPEMSELDAVHRSVAEFNARKQK